MRRRSPSVMWVNRWYLPEIVFLMIFCGLPYLLRERGERWEPYPALLLPAGGGVVDVGGSYVRTSRLELLSVGADGHEHALAPATFFEPLPEHYWVRIAAAGFGLNPTTLSKHHPKATGSAEPAPTRSPEVEKWLRRRLAAVGRGEDRVLRARLVRLTFGTARHRELDRETFWTYDIPL